MAAGLIARVISAALVAVALCACARSPAAERADRPAPAATAQQSLTPSIATTLTALRATLGDRYPLVVVTQPYVPAAPESLATTPRAVLRVDLGDPDAGYVIVYELPDPSAAAARGRDLAAYLASGFGQTNYPPDAQFALSQFGNTLVLAWWSPQHASDANEERAWFERLRGFGQAIPVVK